MSTTYEILCDVSHEELTRKVNAYLKAGWEPAGGVACGLLRFLAATDQPQPAADATRLWAQAMTRREK